MHNLRCVYKTVHEKALPATLPAPRIYKMLHEKGKCTIYNSLAITYGGNYEQNK